MRALWCVLGVDFRDATGKGGRVIVFLGRLPGSFVMMGFASSCVFQKSKNEKKGKSVVS